LLAFTALAADPEVTVRPLDGESLKGRLTELSADKVVVATAVGSRELETAKLMWVEWPALSVAVKPNIWIELHDGSRLAAVTYSASDGKARIGLTTGQAIEISTRAIHTVRFHAQTPELAVQWREITASMAAGDLVVIRKTSMRTIEQGDNEPRIVTEQALDQHEGTLHEVTADVVQFELDGEKVPIRREKLEGLVYYHPAKREFPQPLARLTDVGGSSWPVREVRLEGGRLSATSLASVALSLPQNSLAKLDFSVGNVAYLSELEADSGAGEVALSLQPAAMSYKFSRVFQVRTAPPLGAGSFRIAGQKYDNGLSLHSPAKLVYRVPEGFAKFVAVAGVDDTVVAPGKFNLVIMGDGKELARHAFLPDERRKPLSLALDMKGVRRLSILLETADGQDIGDQLDLCEARFTK
jgi:hypothetical protein